MRNGLRRVSYGVYIAIIIGYVFLATFFSSLTYLDALKFLSFQFFGVFLCGYAILCCVNLRLNYYIQIIGMSYALGFVLQIINYFALVPFGMQSSLRFVVIGEIMIAIIIISRKRTKAFIETSSKDMLLFAWILLTMFSLKFILSFATLYISNEGLINPCVQPKDFFYHCQNTVSAKLSFPMMDMSDLEQVYYYHYFSNLFDAVESIVTGIPVVNLMAHLEQVQGAILIAFGLYSVLLECCKRVSVRSWVCIAVLFSLGNDMATGVSLPAKLYINPFGCDCGIGISLFLVYLIILQIEKKFDLRLFILVCVFASVATGTKGPCALITVAGIGIFLLGDLFKKRDMMTFWYGLGLLLSFFVVYILVVAERSNGTGASEVTASMVNFSLESIKPYYVWTYFGKLTAVGIPGFLATIFCIALWIFEAKPAVSLMVFFCLTMCVLLKVKPRNCAVIGFGAYSFSLALGLVVNQSGSSQMYFVIMGIILAGIGCGELIDELLDKIQKSNQRFVFKLICVFMVITLFVGLKYYNDTSQVWKTKENIAKIVSKNNFEPDVYETSSVRIDEIEAFDWLRENTNTDDLLLNDIYLLDNQEGNFITVSFTERRQWIDGWTYNRHKDQIDKATKKIKILSDCYDGDQKAVQKIMDDGVKYWIHMKIVGDSDTLNSFGSCVFSNSSIEIYRL